MQETIQRKFDQLRQLGADATYWLRKYEKQLEDEREAKRAELAEQRATQQEQAQQHLSVASSEVQERVQTTMNRLKYTAAPWTMDAWQDFPEQQSGDAITGSLRAGVMAREFKVSGINEVPIMLPFINEGHALIISSGNAKSKALSLLRSLVLRALLQAKDDNTEFIMIDPLGMGANFPFQALPTSLRGESIYVEEDEINAQLRRLTDQIRNAQADKCYVLAVADFPRRFNDDALQRLLSVAQQGVKSNIYVILHVDSTIPLPDGYDPSALMDASSVVYATPEGFTARIDEDEYNFVADSAPESPLLDGLLKKIGAN